MLENCLLVWRTTQPLMLELRTDLHFQSYTPQAQSSHYHCYCFISFLRRLIISGKDFESESTLFCLTLSSLCSQVSRLHRIFEINFGSVYPYKWIPHSTIFNVTELLPTHTFASKFQQSWCQNVKWVTNKIKQTKGICWVIEGMGMIYGYH